MAVLIASILVTFVVLALAIGAALDPVTSPTALVIALFFSAMLGACYAPTECPDRLAEKAHAWSVAAMWAAHLERAVDGGACNPSLPLTVGEDDAGAQLDAWTSYARQVSTR